jgi:hypothetical protein
MRTENNFPEIFGANPSNYDLPIYVNLLLCSVSDSFRMGT